MPFLPTQASDARSVVQQPHLDGPDHQRPERGVLGAQRVGDPRAGEDQPVDRAKGRDADNDGNGQPSPGDAEARKI